MSLLDDARRLAAHELRDHHDVGGYGFCPLCQEDFGHAPDCPWLAMPRIVAALEAIQRLGSDEPEDYTGHDRGCRPIFSFCGGDVWGKQHDSECQWQALVAALKGETPA